jgi:hypothetical protein
VQNGAKATISKGSISSTGLGVVSILSGNIDITGGEITASCGVYTGSAGTANISGGSITSSSSAVEVIGNTAAGESHSTKVSTTVTISGTATLSTNSTNVKTDVPCGVFIAGNGAVLNVEGGSITGQSYGISGNGTKSNSEDDGGTEINITGGTIKSTGAMGIYHPQAGTLSMSDGTVEGVDGGIQFCSGTVTVGSALDFTGGTVKATGPDNRAYKEGDGEIPDGAALSITERNYPGGTPTVTINGGTFISEQSQAVMAYTWSNNTASEWEGASQKLIINGGTFTGALDSNPVGFTKKNIHKSGSTYTVNSTAHTVSVPDATAYAGNTVTLTATADCEGTYQWYKDSTPINNATSATYTPEALDAGTYQYKVEFTATNETTPVDSTATVSVYTYTAPADDTTGDNTGDDNNDTTTPTPVITTNPDGSTTETSETTTDDGAKLTTAVDKDVDGNVTGSTVTKEEAKDDGSTVTTETKKDADGNVTATTTTTVSDDNSKVVVEESTDTTDKGATVEQTTTTVYNSDGEVTGITENHDVAEIGNGTNATVTIAKAGDGTVTDATVEIDKTGATKENGVQATFTKKVMSQVNDILGDAADDAKITMSVKDENGNDRYSITLNSAELTPNNTLYIYKQDKDGNYVIVNAKEYTTDEKGQLKLTIKSKNDFVMLNEKEANAATKAVLSTVKASKTTASVKKSKTTTMKLDSGLNMANVKSVVYKTSKSSVATVDKKTGKITAKKAGKATVSAVVTLKNGKTKTVKMTVNVK